ncbi:flavin monoamine oxidase family protein [Zavarzinia compransoris]|uniref:Oxidoreductase n=1 Tax=Zavarzinia compransoris TaxID=1264899 RepID=A0A317E7R8_9PROT|nr:FAD-dependent oxidoreductase [Zavarzinia compransoris]PWR22296.1 oxidoreductase [Zavarzinia compransoris]TDP46940.1 monoamine oxidase [Zavarzinia compransoris]
MQHDISDATVDVCVIGAGFAGLSAARALVAAGRAVRVIEARDRVGGRTKPGMVAGHRVDLGGQWVGPDHRRLRALAARHGIATEPQFETGAKLIEFGGTVKRYEGLIPAIPLLALIETDRVMKRIERMAAALSASAPWAAAGAADLDRDTVDAWLARHVRTAGARALMAIAVRAVFSAEPAEISMLFFLAYIRASGGLEPLISVRGGAQQDRFRGGLHALSEALADEVGRERLRLGRPVAALEQDAAGVTVHGGGEAPLRCRRAIVTVPLALLPRLQVSPPWPSLRQGLAQRSPMGSVIKCHVAYRTPFWRARGLSGEAVSDRGPFSPIFDGTPEGAGEGILTGFLEGEATRRFTARTPEARRAAVIATLTRLFGPEAAHPIDYAENDWLAEDWSGGCYAGLMAPATLTGFGPVIREAAGRIHFAGTETAIEATGYVEGALESGERAAIEVLAALNQDALNTVS